MSNRKKDMNGWYEVKGNPLSKVGVFPYLGSSIDFDGSLGLDPDKIYNVLRPEEELSSDECINSFRLLPWINDHEMLGDSSTPAEEKGVEGVIGEDVYFDKKDMMLKGNIKVFSEKLKDSIELGKDELSCGYRCEYHKESGNFGGERYDITQRKIRGNHLALVDEGRMGPDVAVLDHFSFSIDSKEFQMEQEEKKTEDAKSEDVTLEELATQMADLAKVVAGLVEKMSGEDESEEESEDAGGNGPVKKTEDESTEEKSGMDAAETKALKAQLATMQATVDSMEKDGMKNLLSQISKRDALATSLSGHIGTFDHAEMTLSDVAKYGVEKLAIACDDGQEIAALGGYLHGRKPETQGHGLDSKIESSAISSYISGERK